MKNNLSDLSNHLFLVLEELEDDKVMADEKLLEKQLKLAKAKCDVSKQILDVAKVQVSAIKVSENCNLLNKDMPALIAVKDSSAETANRRKLLGVAE